MQSHALIFRIQIYNDDDAIIIKSIIQKTGQLIYPA